MSRQLNWSGRERYFVLQNGSSVLGQQAAPTYRVPVRFNPLMGFVLAVLFISFFVLGWLTFYLRRCIRQHFASSSLPSLPQQQQQQQQQLQQLQPFMPGLDMATIKSLPASKFSHLKRSRAPLECSICLSEFRESEQVKGLPGCGHLFHVSCIDAWLFLNCTCPVCRSTLLFPATLQQEDPASSLPSSEPMQQQEQQEQQQQQEQQEQVQETAAEEAAGQSSFDPSLATASRAQIVRSHSAADADHLVAETSKKRSCLNRAQSCAVLSITV